MILRLEEIAPGNPLEREVNLSRETIETLTGEVIFEDIRALLAFRTDPIGHVVHYKATGRAEMVCIRCGGRVTKEVDSDDWISLRTQQPEDAHLVLNGSEMNVRFLGKPVLDLKEFVLEALELELSDFPRHDDGDEACQSTLDAADGEEKASPFGVLSKYLD